MCSNKKISRFCREIWYRDLPDDGSDTHTSLLTIDKATLLDAGQYTCRAIDWGMEQCKKIHIDVRDEPDVKVVPMSATVERGNNIQLLCITPNMRSLGIGFGWTKNRALLKLQPGHQVWEDLYPAGSILKIMNAQVKFISLTGIFRSWSYSDQVECNLQSYGKSLDTFNNSLMRYRILGKLSEICMSLITLGEILCQFHKC